MKTIYYSILLKVSLGISFLFALNYSPISSESFSKLRPHKIFFSQIFFSKGFTYLKKNDENNVIKGFADNFWFLETGFAIAFKLLIHDENIWFGEII